MPRRRVKGVRGNLNLSQPRAYGTGISPVRVRKVRAKGEPNATLLQRASVTAQKSVRVLMKRSPIDGKSMPEAGTARLASQTTVKFDDGSSGGYRGATIISKDKTPPPNRGSKVIVPPRTGGGFLTTFTKTTRRSRPRKVG
jgi:hypothetical protein